MAAEAINVPTVPHSGNVFERAGTTKKESRLVFFSLLPPPIYLPSNLRQADSCRCSVPWLTSAYKDMVELTGHAPHFLFFTLTFLKFWDLCVGGIAHMPNYVIYHYEIGDFTFLMFSISGIYSTVKLDIKSIFFKL